MKKVFRDNREWIVQASRQEEQRGTWVINTISKIINLKTKLMGNISKALDQSMLLEAGKVIDHQTQAEINLAQPSMENMISQP